MTSLFQILMLILSVAKFFIFAHFIMSWLISVQVLNEFANVARRKLGLAWPELAQVMVDIRRFATVQDLTVVVHDRGLALAQRHQMNLYDAMVAAAALEAGCSTLWSEDLQHGQKLDRTLTIRNPFR